MDAATNRRRRHIALGILVGMALVLAFPDPVGAAGTSTNAISVTAAPSAGSPHGTYTPRATATSKDVVAVTIDKNSSGCSLSGGVVTFTGAGTCVIDFNDPGNGSYAAAAQVTLSIKVYAQNTITTSAVPTAGSVGGRFAPGASATSGDKVAVTIDKSSTGCALSGVWVDLTGTGRCKVDFNDPGNGPFGPADQVQKSLKVYGANLISVRTPPAAGTIHETYTPVATATSGDKVALSLDPTSTGCVLSGTAVTFSANGVCVIDFNDPGNGAFAPAATVKRAITVGYGNPVPQSPIVITTTSSKSGRPLDLSASGGSGDGAVTYSLSGPGSANCSLNGAVLTNTRPGTCLVVATKAASGKYESASSSATTVHFVALAPRAVRITSALWAGRTMTVRIIGAHFYGRPLVVSNSLGTSALVLRDSGRTLTIRVHVSRHTRRGHYRMTVIFPHGQRTSLRYLVR